MKKLLLISTGLCLSFALPAHATSIHNAQSVANAPTSSLLINADEKALENAKAFVSKVADKGIGFLSNNELSQAQRKAAFKKLLKQNFDMRTIARFALGRYWRSASKAQQTEYLSLFEKMVINVYADRFGEYKGEKLNVKDARPEGKRDILVHSSVKGESGPEVKVDWRLRQKDGRYKVIDIIVEGVSMSLTQRSDFASVIQRGGGNIEVLLEHLRAQ